MKQKVLSVLRYISLACILLVAVPAFAQKKGKSKKATTPAKETAILILGKQEVPISEFEYVYKKNNATAEDAFSEKSIREYLELYTNFKLKVLDAESRGIDTTASFLEELSGYKKQLAKPYLTEKSVTDRLIREAYERMKEEINADHLLIFLDAEADPKDTLDAYQKIMEMRKEVLNGKSFEEVVKTFSTKYPNNKIITEKLGYFTALQMVYPFEQAAYNSKVGDISMPVRTRFGYHLLKVNDRRPSQGKVKTAHLMIRAASGIPAEDSIAAKQKIDEIYQQLISKSISWKDAVEQFTEDDNSRMKEGELPAFGTGMMIPSFENAAFALKNKDDISKPVQTQYGWHIIKLLERNALEDFETLEPQLKNRVQRDSRSELNQIFLIERLKKENEFKENKAAINKVCAKADTTLRKGTWKFDEKDKNLKTVLFTIKDKSYTTKDFYNFVTSVQRERTGSPNYIMQQYYKQFVDKSILEYEEAHLAEKYLDYKMLVKEYRDGILLFQLMDEEVWSKALQDTAGLEAFHKQNENKYRWNERAKVTIYNAIDATTLEEVKKAVQAKTFKVNEPMLKDVKFVSNQAKLTDSTKQMLDAAVAFLKQDTTLTLQVTTYQDAKEKGKLTKARLEAIVSYLIEKGITANRIIAKEGGKLATKKGVNNSKAALQLYGKTNRSLERSFNRFAPLRLQITEGKFQQGENPILEKVTWKKGEYTVNINDRIAWVIIEDIEAPRNKTLDEARGQIISDYQTYLEQQWIEKLKKRYPVTINQEAVKSLIKK